jgi:hypothetical protein
MLISFLALCRRSQALTELEKYTEALRDIESVLSISKKAGVMNKWVFVLENTFVIASCDR